MVPRFRLRFSIRTLAIFVTLACVYFGTWELTKRHGVNRLEKSLSESGNGYVPGGAYSPAPLIICTVEYDFKMLNQVMIANGSIGRRRNYVWFFGRIMKLPGESIYSGSREDYFAELK